MGRAKWLGCPGRFLGVKCKQIYGVSQNLVGDLVKSGGGGEIASFFLQKKKFWEYFLSVVRCLPERMDVCLAAPPFFFGSCKKNATRVWGVGCRVTKGSWWSLAKIFRVSLELSVGGDGRLPGSSAILANGLPRPCFRFRFGEWPSLVFLPFPVWRLGRNLRLSVSGLAVG